MLFRSKTIRLPVHLMEKLKHIRAATEKWDAKFQREPTDAELGIEVGLKTHKVTTAKQAIQPPLSLDAHDLLTGERDMYDTIPDNSVETPLESLAREDMMKAVLGLIPILNARESAILNYRFGLHGATPLTLEKVGKKLNITRERVRQLQTLALSKLKQALIEKETCAS